MDHPEEDRGRETLKRRLRIVAAVAATAGLIALLVIYWQPILQLVSEQERVRALIESFGWAAPLALVVLQAIQIILAPIPGGVVSLVSGYLFGTILGTAYSMAGIILGVFVLMSFARKYGRPFVERFVPERHIERFDRFAKKGGATILFILFLLPFTPDDSIAILAGLTPIPISLLLVLSAVGRFPSVLASSFVGSNAGSLNVWQWAILIGISLGLGIPVLIYRERLQDWMESLAERISDLLGR